MGEIEKHPRSLRCAALPPGGGHDWQHGRCSSAMGAAWFESGAANARRYPARCASDFRRARENPALPRRNSIRRYILILPRPAVPPSAKFSRNSGRRRCLTSRAPESYVVQCCWPTSPALSMYCNSVRGCCASRPTGRCPVCWPCARCTLCPSPPRGQRALRCRGRAPRVVLPGFG